MYLVRRPPGFMREGKLHHVAWGALLLDAQDFYVREPKSTRAAPCVLTSGTFIRDGSHEEPESLPTISMLVRSKPERKRWADLVELEKKLGWVTTQDVTKVFEPGRNTRNNNDNVLTRCRGWFAKHGKDKDKLGDWRQEGENGGHPLKVARVSVLKQCVFPNSHDRNNTCIVVNDIGHRFAAACRRPQSPLLCSTPGARTNHEMGLTRDLLRAGQ